MVRNRQKTNELQHTTNENKLNLLKMEWGDFFYAILNPMTIILIVCTVLLISLHRNTVSNVWFSTILVILIGFIIGIVIHRFNKVYIDIQIERPRIRRGITAIRKLGILVENIRLLEARLETLQIQAVQNDDVNHEVIMTKFEELKNFCMSLQLACFSSIEDWTEILPHAPIATLHAQVIASFLHDREVAMDQLRELHEQLEQSKDQPAEVKTNIESLINEKEKAISELNELLFNSRTSGLWSTLSPDMYEKSDKNAEG
jgi:hypothetical protein